MGFAPKGSYPTLREPLGGRGAANLGTLHAHCIDNFEDDKILQLIK
jgi:hypothetical protein